MDIQTNPSAIATPAPIAGSDTAQSATISSDFETFLKMLTAQMENQDPLNPLDSQDFATQLATFSGVEQQVKTNDLLKALSTNLGVSGLSDMAGWIGREARIAAPAPFDGSPIEVLPDPPISADSAIQPASSATRARAKSASRSSVTAQRQIETGSVIGC